MEQRIEELAQLGAGRTAVDDLAGNALLWQMAGLAYQLLHQIRSTALHDSLDVMGNPAATEDRPSIGQPPTSKWKSP